MDVIISSPHGRGIGTNITDMSGNQIAGAYRADITIDTLSTNKATVYCHAARVDVQANATIKHVCPHCKQEVRQKE